MPDLIDTHCHLNFRAFQGDSQDVIKAALKEKVWMIIPGSQFSTSQRGVKLAELFPQGVFAAVGLHPIQLFQSRYLLEEAGKKVSFASRAEKFEASHYRILLSRPKVVAMGEIGLDFYHPRPGVRRTDTLYKEKADGQLRDKAFISKVRKYQEEVFERQLDLADEFGKPVIVHCRQAFGRLLKILKKRYPHGRPAGGVVHCFTGSLKNAEQLFELGFLVSFTGLITLTSAYNDIVKKIPLAKILVETDAPYLTPRPEKGRNEPGFVRHVVQKIATIKGIPFARVACQTTENARKLFGI